MAYPIYIGGILKSKNGELPLSGLVTAYEFDGDTLDTSGYNNHATNYGASLTTNRFNESNSAYDFNGTSNYMDIGSNVILDFGTNDFSYSYWFLKPSLSPDRDAHVSRNFFGGGDDVGIRMNADGTLNTRLFGTLQNSTPLAYADNIWHHVVFNIDKSANADIYVDNSLQLQVDISSRSTWPLGTSLPWKIGREGTGGEWHQGKIDQVFFYNRLLNSEDIDNLFRYPKNYNP